jgi:hypothetical protein
LIAHLKALAPLGSKLTINLAGQFQSTWRQLSRNADEIVVQIARPTTSAYTFPWNYLYEFPIDEDLKNSEIRVCDLIKEWDEKKPLISGLPRQCPYESEAWHDENVLCPFGFWGYRYTIEQLSSSNTPTFKIEVPSQFEFPFCETTRGVKPDQVTLHSESLAKLLAEEFPKAAIKRAPSRNAVHRLLGGDLPFVYFYCHGERRHAKDPNVVLSVGQKDKISPHTLVSWVMTWFRRSDKVVWENVKPLILVNACHSIAIEPDTFVNYVEAFMGTANAAGVIGTEVKVHQLLAMNVAEQFFEKFFKGWSVDQALRDVKLNLLAHGNLFGLVYTPYCWADLSIASRDSQ